VSCQGPVKEEILPPVSLLDRADLVSAQNKNGSPADFELIPTVESIDDTYRRCVRFPNGFSLVFRFDDVQQNSRFQFSAGLRESEVFSKDFDVITTVIEPDNTRHNKSDASGTSLDPGIWHDFSLSLDEYAGQKIQILLNVDSEKSTDDIFIANPSLSFDTVKPRRVFLICVDTLRADRIGAYVNSDDLTPHVDSFAAESIRFANAISTAPWTLPSVGSVVTGLYPGSDVGNLNSGLLNKGYRCARTHQSHRSMARNSSK